MELLSKIDGSLSELLDSTLPSLFPDHKSSIYYDLLRDEVMCNPHVFDPTLPDGFIHYDDASMLVVFTAIERKMKSEGYKGRYSKQVVEDAMQFLAHRNPRNLRLEWLESLEWDGTPRIRACFRDVIGATTNLSEEENERYIGDVTTAWMMGSIARQYAPTQVDVIPLLIGEQRIGKGNAIRFITGGQDWYIDTACDVSDPKAFLENINGAVIVELSEASSISSKDSEKVKAFISKREDRYRKSYAKEAGNFPRRWVAIASSNIRTPFTDITGNARYFPFYCKDSETNLVKAFFKDKALAKSYSEQLWAEAMYLYRHGATPYLSPETMELSSHVQEEATSTDDAVDYLNDTLNKDEEYSKVGAFITNEDISEIMKGTEYSEEYFGKKRAFTFKWYNSGGCKWVKKRKQVTGAFGTTEFRRGYVRVSE